MNTMVYGVKSLSVKYSNMNFERFLPFFGQLHSNRCAKNPKALDDCVMYLLLVF